MPKFRKRPVEIEAQQITWANWGAVAEFIGDALGPDNPARTITADEASDTCGEPGPDYIAIELTTTQGEPATFRHGDWVVGDSKPGTFYPCKPDVFEATHEPVNV